MCWEVGSHQFFDSSNISARSFSLLSQAQKWLINPKSERRDGEGGLLEGDIKHGHRVWSGNSL